MIPDASISGYFGTRLGGHYFSSDTVGDLPIGVKKDLPCQPSLGNTVSPLLHVRRIAGMKFQEETYVLDYVAVITDEEERSAVW